MLRRNNLVTIDPYYLTKDRDNIKVEDGRQI